MIGKPSLQFAKAGVEEYAKRIGRWGTFTLHPLKKGTPETESPLLLEKSQGMLRIALDERGELFSTRHWSNQLETWRHEHSAGRKIAFLIGGADGHTETLRVQCDAVWSLSGLTLQHELALVLLAEQVYRVHTLWAGMPYHRD